MRLSGAISVSAIVYRVKEQAIKMIGNLRKSNIEIRSRPTQT